MRFLDSTNIQMRQISGQSEHEFRSYSGFADSANNGFKLISCDYLVLILYWRKHPLSLGLLSVIRILLY